MELVESTRSALDDGVRVIVRELTESAHKDIGRKIIEARVNRGFAYREGLRELRERLPEYERRLIDLHLDLGARDPEAIAESISAELRQHVSTVGRSIACSFRGRDVAWAGREAMQFEADIGGYAAGVAGRVRVAVELQRRKDQAGAMKALETQYLPMTRARTLAELLTYGESAWLDWKGDFWAGVVDSKHVHREEHRGKLLKAIVSIANSIVDERGYLVFGVEDKPDGRNVVGVKTSFDDATFQDWSAKAFNPPVQFRYLQEEREGRRVGFFEIMPSSDYPHVCAQEFKGEMHVGQVWLRRGTRNSIAAYSDFKRMFAPAEPLRVPALEGAVVAQVKALWEPEGWEVCGPRLDERDEKLAQGWRLAYEPGRRREIRLCQGNVDHHVLMLRRKRSR